MGHYITTTNLGETTLRLTIDQGIKCAATLRRTLIALGYTIGDAYAACDDAMHCGLVA